VLRESPAGAQQAGKTYRVGIITGRTPTYDRPLVDAFRRTLASAGYQDGKNLQIVYRSSGGDRKRLPELAVELVGAQPDVIVANGPDTIRAAKRATTTIPIVMVESLDPVALGFVANWARPGGNITGMANMNMSLIGKWLQLLKELVPHVRRVAVLVNPATTGVLTEVREAERLAKTIGIETVDLPIESAGRVDAALKTLSQLHVGAILELPGPINSSNGARIVRDVAVLRLPAIYANGTFADLGGLMSYGPSETGIWNGAATYVDRILKGAKPADLPVVNPTIFELIINLKTAHTLGITFPQSILLRADRIIR